MNIAYDIFIQFPQAIEDVKKIPELDTFFMEVLQFVESRLKPLEAEINAEEDADEEPRGTIIFVMRNDDKFINFANYSENLRIKMLGCFTSEDITYILKKIELINKSRNN